MTAEVFLDANILLYANSKAPLDREKCRKAQQLMLAAPFALSTQVLQEFIANALRKKNLGISEANIDATLELASQGPVQPVTLEIVLIAVSLRRRFQPKFRKNLKKTPENVKFEPACFCKSFIINASIFLVHL